MTGSVWLAILLAYGILTMWAGGRGAWSALQIAVFASVGVWAVQQWRRPSPVTGSMWLAPLCAAPLWGLVQLAAQRSVYRWGTWNAVLNWTTWAALFFLALQWFREREARQQLLSFAVYFGAVLSVLGTVQMLTSHGKVFWLFASGYPDFVIGPFVNRNQYAAFLETILPIAMWRALRERRSLPYYVLASAMAASVVVAASRAGTILMVAEAGAVPLLARRRGLAGKRVAAGTAVFSALALVFVFIGGWSSLSRRMHDPDPLAGRREMLESSAAMFRARPMMGFGLGNWPRAYPQYALFDDGTYINQAHNDWAQWAVEGGAPFALVLLSLAVMTIPAAVRSVWGIGLLSVWVHCLVEYPLQQRPALAAWFFVLLGLLAAERESRRRLVRPLDRLVPRVHIEGGEGTGSGSRSVRPLDGAAVDARFGQFAVEKEEAQ